MMTTETIQIQIDEDRAILPKNRTLALLDRPTDTDQIIENVRTDYAGWVSAAGKATKRLWNLLGSIYAEVPQFEEKCQARAKLVHAVICHPDLHKNNRWIAREKSATDLFLTLLLGLKENRPTKSQWKRVLAAAHGHDIPRSQSAFVDWVKRAGGVIEAAAHQQVELIQANPAELLSDLGSRLDRFLDEDASTEISVPDEMLSEGKIIVTIIKVARQIDGQLKPRACGFIETPAFVKRAGEELLRQHEAEEKAYRKEAEENAKFYTPERLCDNWRGAPHQSNPYEQDVLDRARQREEEAAQKKRNRKALQQSTSQWSDTAKLKNATNLEAFIDDPL